MRTYAIATAAAALVVGLAACSAPAGPEWSPVAVQVPGEIVSLTTSPGGLLVGSYAGADPRPRLTLVAMTGSSRDVPAIASPGYGGQARWLSVVVDGSAVTAVGGARGGAHGNVRWTEWIGDLNGIRDVPQSFLTFGGEEAGDVVGAAYLGNEPVIVGGWASPTSGYDIATYRLDGTQWQRTSPGAPALASTKGELLSAASVTSRPAGLVIVGSAQALVPSLPVRPAVWLGRPGTGSSLDWSRITLEGGSPAEARTADCSGDTCLIAGTDRGRLALWTLTGDHAGSEQRLEDVPVGEKDVVLVPTRSGDGWVVVVRSPGTSRLVAGSGSDWHPGTLPAGAPVALAATGDTTWLATTDKIWVSRPSR